MSPHSGPRPWVIVPLACAGVTAATGAIFLALWILQIDTLGKVYSDWVSLKANSALCFMLLGAGAWLTFTNARNSTRSLAGMGLVLVAIAISGVILGSYIFDWRIGIDELLASDHSGVGDPGRMSSQDAASFLFVGVAIACLSVEKLRAWVCAPASFVAVLISSLAILGYLYGVSDVTDIGSNTHMSLATSLLFFTLSSGVFLSISEVGLGSLIWRQTMGGARLRARLPFLLIVPPLIGLARHYAEVQGWFSAEAGVTLMVFVLVWTLIAFLMWEAYVLSKAESVNILFAEMISGIKDYAIFTLDANGIVSSWNEGAERMTQFTTEEIVGRHLLTFYPPEDLLRTSPDEELAQAAREGRVEREGWRTRKDGTRYWASAITTAMFDPDGRLVGYSRITRDLTQRRRDEEQLRQLNAELEAKVAERTRELADRAEELSQSVKELKRSNEELEQFAYVASHDLQEPLRMVGNYTQLLARHYQGQLDEEADEFIGYAVEGAQRMQVLINDLLLFSRVGTRGQAFAPVQLNEVFDLTVHDLEMAIDDAGGVVTRDDLPVVMGDKVQLCQLLLNLIGNAIKFHGAEPPRVHVSCQRTENDWRITVSDNGIGIASEHQQRIFVIFQRLHARSEYKGTGIGLAVCKRIVERHGGRLTVESALNEGSKFSFNIEGAEVELAMRIQEGAAA
jgi:PAS domain S-box-containing protein